MRLITLVLLVELADEGLLRILLFGRNAWLVSA